MTTATAEDQSYPVCFFILSDHDVTAWQLAENMRLCQCHSARGFHFQIPRLVDELLHNLTSLRVSDKISCISNFKGNKKGHKYSPFVVALNSFYKEVFPACKDKNSM